MECVQWVLALTRQERLLTKRVPVSWPTRPLPSRCRRRPTGLSGSFTVAAPEQQSGSEVFVVVDDWFFLRLVVAELAIGRCQAGASRLGKDVGRVQTYLGTVAAFVREQTVDSW